MNMDAKLLQLSDLLYTIQDMQEKLNLQILDLKQGYFCYEDVHQEFYSRAKLNCGIAEDYNNNIFYKIEEAREVVEELIKERAREARGEAC